MHQPLHFMPVHEAVKLPDFAKDPSGNTEKLYTNDEKDGSPTLKDKVIFTKKDTKGYAIKI